MHLSKEDRELFKSLAKSLAKSAATAAVFEAASAIIGKLATTNFTKKTLSGDKIMKPTEDETILDRKEAAGNENKGSMASDNVSGQEGEVGASATEAKANQNEAKAAETCASAMQTGAGAMEISTKSMKVN